METFGEAVRRLRGPMSQRQLARRAHIDPGHLSRLESGQRRPTEKLAATIDAALDAGGVLLALAASPSAAPLTTHPSGVGHNGGQPMAGPTVWESAEDDEMNRRDLLRLLSVAGASVTALPGEPAPVDWARLADAADRDAPLDQTMIDQYTQVNANLWSAYAGAQSNATVLAAAHGQIQALIGALRRPGMPTQRQRLCGLLGETLQLTGEIHFDRNQYTEAAHCYTLAATASREAEAYDLWACALTRQAIIANFERQHGAAYNLGSDDVYLFRTPHLPTLARDWRERAVTVAMATAAAPTYLPSMPLDGTRLVYGGVWANNPAMVALTEAVGPLGQPLDAIRVLSLGTTTDVRHRSRRLDRGGLLPWARDAIEVLMRAQSESATKQLRHFLDPDRVLRLNPTVPTGAVALDKVDADELIGRAAHESRTAAPAFTRCFADHLAAAYLPHHPTPKE